MLDKYILKIELIEISIPCCCCINYLALVLDKLKNISKIVIRFDDKRYSGPLKPL